MEKNMNRVWFGLIFSVALFGKPVCYKEGYGNLIVSVDENEIVLKNGATLPYETSDTKNTWYEKLNNADLKIQPWQQYDSGGIDQEPPYLYSPGRLRYQPFFQALYGKTRKDIHRNLVYIDWKTTKGSIKLLANMVGDVDKKLIEINKELMKLPKKERKLADSASTYNFRYIRDTNRLSMHSFGIAIDLSPHKTQYWKSVAKSETALIDYKNSMPLSIVKIFEKYGFIWGGRWYHYDTMHFEYRPELLAPSCVAKTMSESKSEPVEF